MKARPEYNRFMDYLLYRSLKGDTTADEDQRLREWRAASPDHEAQYRELEALLSLTEEAGAASGAPEVPAELYLARSAAGTGAPGSADRGRGHHSRTRVRSPWLWWVTGGLGTAAASVLLMLTLRSWTAPAGELLSLGVDEFVTGSADVATVQLRDGTIVRLAPQSRLRLTGSAGTREVTLDGRAYFAVAGMERHPFTVRTRGGDAVVLGTRFEAEAHGDALRVLVVEGRVALAASGSRVELGAGEMARAVEGAVSAAVSVPDAHERIAWVGNFLVFQRTPVREVATEISRHFHVEVDVRGTDLDSQIVTAWFSDPTVDDVFRVVCKVLAAECSTLETRLTIDLTSSTP